MAGMDKFTINAQEALVGGQERAAALGHQQIEPLHLLAALAAQKEGVVAPLLGKLNVRAESLLAEAEAELARLPQVWGAAEQYLSPATNDLLKRAFDEAGQFKDEYVSTEHLLLALASCGNDAAAGLLARHGATGDRLLEGEVQKLVKMEERLRDRPGAHVVADGDGKGGELRFSAVDQMEPVASN